MNMITQWDIFNKTNFESIFMLNSFFFFLLLYSVLKGLGNEHSCLNRQLD